MIQRESPRSVGSLVWGWLWRYGMAACSTALALAIGLLLRANHLPHPFISFSFLAIAATFWYAGLGPGVVALLLSCLATKRFFAPLPLAGLPVESFFLIYGIFAASVGWFSASRRRAERLLREARDHLERRVAERTTELTRTNNHLQTTQVELRTEKDRLKLLLDLTNNLVSTLNIRDALKSVVGHIRQVTESDFVGVGLPDTENDPRNAHALDFVVDGDIPSADFPDNGGTLPVRVFHTRTSWTEGTQGLQGLLSGALPFSGLQLKTVCVFPLLSRERALGIILLGRQNDLSYPQATVDFLEQVANQVAIAVENALSYRQIAELTEKLSQEKLYLEDEIRSDSNFEEIIGTSEQLRRILKLVETVAPTDSTVLLNGETGTGKELLARAIHSLSPRREKTFVRLNCAAIPAGLLESELFGHEKGAFTGAIAQRIGRMELANGGTLFLDEISEIPLELQPKLLRVLQEREFERLGSTRTLRTDVRLIAATNRDLPAMVEAQEFRADLFFRLNVFPVQIPPLRERAEDIPLLVRHFANEFARRMDKVIETVPSETMKALSRYSWPGNIRELQNVIERAVILSPGPILNVPIAELPSHPEADSDGAESDNLKSRRRRPVRSILADVDRDQILQALKEAEGRIGGRGGAADLLGLKRTTLITRMNKLGIDARDVSEPHDIDADTSDTSKLSTR